MGVALEGYALLKVAGKGEALKGARRELSARFAKGKAKEPALANRPAAPPDLGGDGPSSPADEAQSLVRRAFCFMREAFCSIDEAFCLTREALEPRR